MHRFELQFTGLGQCGVDGCGKPLTGHVFAGGNKLAAAPLQVWVSTNEIRRKLAERAGRPVGDSGAIPRARPAPENGDTREW